MRQFKTHVCLVCKNEELNITPALHPGFKPDNVLLIYTSWHKEKALNLSLIFNQHNINTEFLEIKVQKERLQLESLDKMDLVSRHKRNALPFHSI